jgi:hypothetical protein
VRRNARQPCRSRAGRRNSMKTRMEFSALALGLALLASSGCVDALGTNLVVEVHNTLSSPLAVHVQVLDTNDDGIPAGEKGTWDFSVAPQSTGHKSIGLGHSYNLVQVSGSSGDTQYNSSGPHNVWTGIPMDDSRRVLKLEPRNGELAPY